MKTTTILFLVKDDKVLLAMKKERFGKGKWNGVGGKAEPGESPEQAAQREAREEIGIKVKELEKVAILKFVYPKDGETENKGWDQECYTYICRDWEGEPQETEEMRPQWFGQSELPFDQMWPDDPLWLPRILAGERLDATFELNPQFELVSHKIIEYTEK
jgi:mutator protein MutT